MPLGGCKFLGREWDCLPEFLGDWLAQLEFQVSTRAREPIDVNEIMFPYWDVIVAVTLYLLL